MIRHPFLPSIMLILLLTGCDDKSSDPHPDNGHDFTVDLGVENNMPRVTITSEDDSDVQTLLCERVWLDEAETQIGCFLEKRAYGYSHYYRIAMDHSDFDESGLLIGYTVDINGELYVYGSGLNEPVECGEATEIPIVDLDIMIYPSSNVSPLRACVGLGEVWIMIGDQTYYGCYIDIWSVTQVNWLTIFSPEESQLKGEYWSYGFTPDVPGNYIAGWEIVMPNGSNAEVVTITAVIDPYVISYGGFFGYYYHSGLCWVNNGFWFISSNNLIKTDAVGGIIEQIQLADTLTNLSGLAYESGFFWTISKGTWGPEPYHDRLCKLDSDGNLVYVIEIPSDYEDLVADNMYIWLGDSDQSQLRKMGHDGQVFTDYTIDSALGEIAGLALAGGDLWISFNNSENDIGGVGLFVEGEGIVESYPFEFAHPNFLTYDGVNLWCFHEFGLTKLNLP